MGTTLLRAATMTSLKTYSVVSLGGISYYVGNRVERFLPKECDTGGATVPAVVFGVENPKLSTDLVQDVFADFQRRDDVFQPAFTSQSVLIAFSTKHEQPTPTLPESMADYLASKGSKLLFLTPDKGFLPDGPYFLRGRSLHKAWRLYEDENQAFTVPVIPSEEGDEHEFEPLHAGAYSGLYPVIGVPSRLYSPSCSEKPLNGVRFSIKDNHNLAGIRTSLGSRSYTKLYGPQKHTAVLIEKLLSLGAVIVGKTKMGAYTGSEVPPEKCIDYLAPWNPRGDGYQGPSGSSSGAGSSVSSYEWLDVALGTDSTGSIRMPAASYGLWGLRATWDAFNLDGIVPNVPKFDTLGVLTREPKYLREVILSSQSLAESPLLKAQNLVFPMDWFPMRDSGQQRMIDLFLELLQTEKLISIKNLSLESEWAKTGPEKYRHLSLQKFLDKSIYWPNYYDGFHILDEFRSDFHEKFSHPPYASPFMTRRWDLADNISEEQRDQGYWELEIYYSWVAEHILKVGTEDNMMILPLGRPGANYRDIVPVSGGGDFSSSAYDPVDFCTVLGLPQLVIPIGQNPYRSRVTKRTEYAPIVATLAGPRGSDRSLLQFATSALQQGGWPLDVLSGVNAFHPGDNERHVGDIRFHSNLS